MTPEGNFGPNKEGNASNKRRIGWPNGNGDPPGYFVVCLDGHACSSNGKKTMSRGGCFFASAFIRPTWRHNKIIHQHRLAANYRSRNAPFSKICFSLVGAEVLRLLFFWREEKRLARSPLLVDRGKSVSRRVFQQKFQRK